jgi:hypothetical protein
MAKKQTRRSVSLSKETYNLLKAKCDKEGVTMSGVVSQLIEDYLAGNAKPAPSRPAPKDDGHLDAAEAPEPRRANHNSGGAPRYVVNADLIISGAETEAEAEQVVGALVARLVKKGEIAEALVLSADPE